MADKKKVLLVDDDPDFVEAIKVIVENGGYAVRVAYDGAEGLEAVAEEKPDLIVLDVMMPVMNGHEACAKLKADPQTAKIPIILLTAVADRVTTSTYTHRDMLESQAEDYMPKPVEPMELLNLIKHWLK
ncbi:response regulator [Desulfoprunum benzoelyticum]|jgi:two-component system, OmpR family, alkaline phosphatase synthesis response regulator PhoP|uniref:Two-component system alkaline phosphatase synthesis response regulator PhoP n=1 Tax=Desulfoprunum benzoelyticum TaxID=1506996 RepID=A0A840UX38_9BACT|nr:response regulator [Desulfoprunum benzoelyticum]MBB5348004.1 two-component system alkaline phosphatase synthesis response regulator PhoP [Desulfoprunum benzoelyticum]MBM9530416.1 response regulator [Desulfoprunum benzoelyticum]HSO09410.1 response regulator [Desulfoprunum sp.]